MKHVAILLLSLFCLSVQAADSPAVDIPFEKFVLDNGLTVIVHEDRKAPVVAVNIWYHVGSKDEKPGKTGFAHLFEHLMFNGSENFDGEYFQPFEQVGATDINGNTWFDRTNYFETVPTPALEMALWMESDRMGHLLGAVTQEKLDNQRGVVQNEKRQGDNQPYGMVEYSQLQGLFPEGHPYRWSSIGSMEDLDAASLDDVKEWFKNNYGAANVVLVLAGDINIGEARPLVEKYFGHIPPGPPLKRLTSMVPKRSTDTREQLEDRVPQARIYRTWAVAARNELARAELELAAAVLGDGKNSRLYKDLVYDRQLATSVSASVQPFELASLFEVTVTLRPEADLVTVNKALDGILSDFLEHGPTSAELDRVKTGINAGFIRGVEKVGNYSGKASVLGQGELYAGDPGFFKTHLAWINNADPTSVKAAARDWLSQGYHQIDVVPFPDYVAGDSVADRSKLPEVAESPDLVFPEVQRSSLKNGIQVVLAQRHTIPVVEFALQFDAGYAADAGRKVGTASYTMAMLDEGTRTRSALQISEQAENLGAVIGAGSNLDTSAVTLSAIKDKLAPSLELFADIVRNPAFSDEEIERLRPRWLAGIKQEKNQPVGVALRVLPPLLYGEDHAYGIPFTGSGTEASIAAMSREELIRFHADWLRPDNATLFVVGDTTLEEILPLLDKYLGSWKAPRSAKPQKTVQDVSLPPASRLYLVDKPGAPQSLILAGHLAPPTGVANNIAIETMNDALGGQFTARVNMNLREDKGWSYGAFTLLWGARYQRPFMVYAPVQTEHTGESLQELMAEMTDFLGDKPPTQSELDRYRNNSIRSLPGQYETAGSVLQTLQANARYGRADDYVAGLKQQYEGLTVTDLEQAAEQTLKPGQLTWVIVGDVTKIEEEVRGLDLGEVSIIKVD